MGTEIHPIEAFSSGSPPSDGHTTQVIIGGTTEVISVTDSSTTTDEEYTYVPVTSTPVKKNAPAFIDNKEAIWLYAELFLGHHGGSCHG